MFLKSIIILKLIYNHSFKIIAVCLIAIFLYKFVEYTNEGLTTVKHHEIQLADIKEIQNLIITRFVIGKRVKIHFGKSDKTVEKSTRYLDYVAMMTVDVEIPMENIKLTEIDNRHKLIVEIEKVVVTRPKIVQEKSFIWYFSDKNMPSEAVQVAANKAERDLYDNIENYIHYIDVRTEIEQFFVNFFHQLDIFQIEVVLPLTMEKEDPGLSKIRIFDEIKELASLFNERLPSNKKWYIDPEIFQSHLKIAKRYTEFSDISDKNIVFIDTGGNSKTGMFISSDKIIWRNGYFRKSHDSKIFSCTIEEFANMKLWNNGDDTRIFIDTLIDNETVFFDCRDKKQIETIMEFLQDLQKIINTAQEESIDESLFDEDLELFLLQMEEEEPV